MPAAAEEERLEPEEADVLLAAGEVGTPTTPSAVDDVAAERVLDTFVSEVEAEEVSVGEKLLLDVGMLEGVAFTLVSKRPPGLIPLSF